ncbi:E3 ubiquitin-protein ligase TRIM11-like isoform X1 [Zootoca vivipara]|uniref:E3 ubiquitin-protein ligase TRIM11-like isoform X1 n=1 Tax=Zootoca vivipara TaxID=8524 RepID=UPI00293B8D87|nr:E3 ubiquitin-protein ligase TRIM11-like isoform X1 [Zootoca vivipara]
MAVAGRPVQNLCDEATCSICLEYFKDPVINAEYGHNFCRSCLIQCWGESEAEASCPQCRKRVQRRSLIPNRQLANVVEIAKNLSLQEGKQEGGKGRFCEKHQEPLKLFCKVHEAPICLVCDRSKEHENHKVIPLEEAFKEYKGEICHYLKILRKEREEILAYQADLGKESKDLLKLTETERLKTVEKFRELHQFLEEKEKLLLTHVEEVEKEIAGERDEQLARLSRKLSSLENIIQEMEEKCQQPASELLQGEICHYLKILRKEREEILAYQADLDKESKDLLKLTETERLKAVEKFRQLRQLLEEQEKRLLDDVEEVEKEIAGRRDEQLERLSRKLSSLDRIIREMEEKGQQPASELLQDVRSTLQRYEKRESPEKPLAFPPELRNRILESCDLKHLVEDAMKQWKDAVLYRKPIQKDVQSFRNLQRANVTLDPDTAYPWLILWEEGKGVSWGDEEQDLPDNPERFNEEPSVLGREGFTAGSHFWEVYEGSGEMWAMGVARKSVERKGRFPLSPEEGVWAVEKWGDEYFACTSPDSSPLYLSWEPRRIRVTLDYEGGCVSFSDADSGAELYTFSGASFSGETLLPFFYLDDFQTYLGIS